MKAHISFRVAIALLVSLLCVCEARAAVTEIPTEIDALLAPDGQLRIRYPADLESRYVLLTGSNPMDVNTVVDTNLGFWGIGSFTVPVDYLASGAYFQLRMESMPNAKVAIACSGFSYFGLRTNGTLWQWGKISDNLFVREPRQVGNDIDWCSIVSSANGHHAALKRDHSLWLWGGNAWGALGDGTIYGRSEPWKLEGAWKMAACGYSHTIAIRSDGTLWGWGCNEDGQLGDDTVEPRYRPVPVHATGPWVAVAAGGNCSFAVKSDGSLWGFGWGPGLGIDRTSNQRVPVPVGAKKGWRSFSSSGTPNGGRTMAIGADFSLWGWGNSAFGILGQPDPADRIYLVPIQIGAPEQRWVDAALGNLHAIGLDLNGNGYGWGSTIGGGSGLDASNGRVVATPQLLNSGSGWTAIAAAGSTSLALKEDGSLWNWGSVYDPSTGTFVQTNRPVRIGTDNDWGPPPP